MTMMVLLLLDTITTLVVRVLFFEQHGVH